MIQVEEEYVTLDLGPEMDPKYLQTEGTYQLIVSYPSNEVESKSKREMGGADR